MTCVSLYNIKQRSHPHHPTPDRLNLKINQRSHPHHPTPDRLNLKTKQRSPLHHPQTRSPISSNQTAIAPSPPKTRSPISSTSNSDRPSTPTKPDRLNLKVKQRSPPHHPQNPIAYFPTSNSDRLNGQNLTFKLVYNQAVRYIFTLQR